MYDFSHSLRAVNDWVCSDHATYLLQVELTKNQVTLSHSPAFRLPKTLSSFTESVTSTLKGTLRKKKDANKGLSIMNTVLAERDSSQFSVRRRNCFVLAFAVEGG